MNLRGLRIYLSGMALFSYCLIALATTAAFAGTACTQQPLTPDGLAQASRLGVELFKILDQSNAQVVILSRVGSDLSKYKLRFSHAGFALRDNATGRWTIIHLLNRCGTDHSSIYDEGLINFFLDDPFSYDVLIAVPHPEAQRTLVKILRSEKVWQMHQPHYNTIAHPQSSNFQNSNQWLLELVVAAMANGAVHTRRDAHQHLLMRLYQPDRIAINRLTRLGGGLFKANITFTDHPLADRLKGEYNMVTVRSVIRFLYRAKLLDWTQWLNLRSAPKIFTGADIEYLLEQL